MLLLVFVLKLACAVLGMLGWAWVVVVVVVVVEGGLGTRGMSPVSTRIFTVLEPGAVFMTLVGGPLHTQASFVIQISRHELVLASLVDEPPNTQDGDQPVSVRV